MLSKYGVCYGHVFRLLQFLHTVRGYFRGECADANIEMRLAYERAYTLYIIPYYLSR
jgi:hypothetical protein